MRGADSCNEALFSTVKLEEFVPQTHPLRPIRKWMNEALSKMDVKFWAMYEADVKGGCPSIAPEKFMRAMLQVCLLAVPGAACSP
ncbi:transposase (fragment) [Thiomonas sp. CB3]